MKDFTNSRAYYVILILFILIAFVVGGYRTLTTNPEIVSLEGFGDSEESESLEPSGSMELQKVSKVNLFSNPSFETDPGSYVFKVGSENNKRTNEFARTGEYSYYIGPLQAGATSPRSAIFIEVPAGDLKNNTEYEVSAWYKTVGDTESTAASLEIGLYTADKEYISTYTEDMYASEEWVKVTERVLTRETPTALRVEFIQAEGDADIWIDDISLVEWSPAGNN